MADELKKLTGGTLLLRSKYQVQEVEEKVRHGAFDVIPSDEDEATAPAGTLTEFYEAQSRWGRDISTEEHV
ncbi:hypothetical protein RIF29_41422 [Crotalaria pallida]|uniref:Uncharacterized protein n=1 Tax=Crotalaria pallida TaxID=3830 RepID=A0AAN9E506_CROPI